MEKELREITYDELSCILQKYLDRGETIQALEYCRNIAIHGNPYGYMFMGFIYEEGHGPVEVDYQKALYCYQKTQEMGVDMTMDIAQLNEKMRKYGKI